jgi:hypothetical protein
VFGDGHVFPGDEAVAIELEPGLIIIRRLGLAIKRPAAAAEVYQVPELVLLPVPEALDPAAFARSAPLIGNQVTIIVKRANS